MRLESLEDRVTPANQMLPDLQVLQSYLSGWTVNTTTSGGREVRFSTGMANGGKGAFELNGTTNYVTDPDGTQRQLVNQKIYWDDGSFTTRPAGYFVYHPAHGHVHFDDFAWGQLRLRPSDNSVGDIVAVGPKTSFCLLDSNHYAPSLPGSPASAGYPSCGNQVQGISVGWNDVYGSGLAGQSIDVTGLPNGNYWLEVVADPSNHILELDETNNVTRVAISLTTLPTYGFRVQSATPTGASFASTSYAEFNFNQAVDPTTFTPSDVTMTGPAGAIPITSITQISSVKFRANFALQAAVGTYQIAIGPDIFNTSGQRMDQNNNGVAGEAADLFQNIFTIAAPHVQGGSPTGSVAPPISSVQITYTQPMDSASFTVADVYSFTGPGGTNLLSNIASITPATSGGTSAAFIINFTNPLTAGGAYSIVIDPTVTNPAGISVDQNDDGLSNASDRYTIAFNVQIPGIAGPDAFGYSASNVPVTNMELVGAAGSTAITFSGTDDANTAIPLGTNSFNLYGVNYTGANQLYVSTNGVISFGQGTSAYDNGDLKGMTYNSVTVYPPAIAVLWDDLVKGPGTPHALYRFVDANSDGTPERLIIQWNQVYHYSTSPSPMTFQASLELNTGNTPGEIILNYPDIDSGDSTANGASATVGIRANGQTGTVLLVSNSGSNSIVGNNKAIRIAVPTVSDIHLHDANPAPDGEVEFEVHFSGPVTGVDAADFKIVTTGNIAGAMIKHVHTTADPSVYDVLIHSGAGSGTLRLDIVDDGSIFSDTGAQLGGTGLLNGDFVADEGYTIVQRAPQVQGTNIGDGTAQRSRVTQVQVVFDHAMAMPTNPSDAFLLVGPNGPVAVTVDTSTSSSIQTVARLTFSGPGTEFGSLADGSYTLTMLASKLSTGGVALDGNGDGTPGDNAVVTFHRLFGDVDGNRAVNAADFMAFRLAFLQSSTIFSFDGSGTVDADDFMQFRLRFLTSV
ncbi:MAG: hypothetical protein K1X57_04615 [Gemmataceae bacterium]|nr:hypothetical protein [Gemmataceae bacterium]